MLSSAFDLLLVILGFSLIIVVHELGHFIAARWAGIRVLAFAVGFGPAICSYRPGLGFRPGSSEGEFRAMVKSGKSPESGGTISPTEYRLNVLPLGGYVKMLGQDDSDPTATSDASDSYQNCPPPKRMVVISAGVIMNLLLAALLFWIVFTIGLKTEPARIGLVTPGSPAANATPMTDSTEPGARLIEPGLRPGDEVLAVDGERVDTFNDVSVKVIMAKGGRDLNFLVRREVDADKSEELMFRVSPRESRETRTLEVGIAPMTSTTLGALGPRATRESIARFESVKARFGILELQGGDRLVEVNGRPVLNVYALREAAAESGGEPISAVFERPDGKRVEVDLTTSATMQESLAALSADRVVSLRHLLGLLPVLSVADVAAEGEAAGLRPGDVFARLGPVEYPSVFAGITQIRSHAGKTIPVVVLRQNDGAWREVDLGEVPVSKQGTVGFEPIDSAKSGAWVTVWPSTAEDRSPEPDGSRAPTPLRSGWLPGTRIVSVDGSAVSTLVEVRDALKRAAEENKDGRVIAIGYALPVSGSSIAAGEIGSPTTAPSRDFQLDSASRDVLARLTWEPDLPLWMFEPESVVLRETNPLAGIRRGIERTHNVMMMTYLTFIRLFEGTVKVEHIKGPVGIAHIGTLLAGKGIDWLLFFLALISVNLAVINFLPIPITDGGHFLFLLYEQLTGKPPPVVVQNAAALIGFVLLGGVFLFVLVNDIMNLAR